MATDLTRIGERAWRSPKLVFTSLYHHVTDVDNLRACYEAQDGRKAVGVDGVTKAKYGRDLEGNLRKLSQRLRDMSYRPKPSRRSYIPKPGSAKGRPLGISSFEDKIVEASLKQVLEQIYETVFVSSSYGYRPGRSPHGCLDLLGRTIQRKRIHHVVDADIRGFFDHVNHAWLMRFLEHRIGDPRILRLIQRLLKAGIMEDGLIRASIEGTPQGSILSPLLSNVYLHYVLDLWFERRFRRQCRGEAYLFRFADDFVVCFQDGDDAARFMTALPERLADFNLTLAEEKTRCIRFGRYARVKARRAGRKPEEFTFLGFTHYCGKTRNGDFKVKRRTSRKKFQATLRKFTEWARDERGRLTKGEMLRSAVRRVGGHLNYYAITDNLPHCRVYVQKARRILFKWINRKSQRRAYTWETFDDALRTVNWPRLTIRKDLCPFRRAEAL